MMTTPLVCLLLTPRSRLRADRIVVSIASWVPLNRSRPPATTSSLLLSMRAVGRRSRSLSMMFRRTRVSASRTRLDCGNFRRIAPSSKNSFNCTRRPMVTSIEWTSSSVGARRGRVSAMSVRVSSVWHEIVDIVSSTPGWISETSWKLESDSRWKDLQCESEEHPGWPRLRRSSFNAHHWWTWVQTARQKDGKIEEPMQHVQRADGCIESRNIHGVPMSSHWRPFVVRKWRDQVPGRRQQACKTCAYWLSYRSSGQTIRMTILVCTNSMEIKIRTWEHETKIIKLQMWDTTEQERCRTITSNHHIDTHDIRSLLLNRTRRQRRVPQTTKCQIWRQPW